MVRKLYHTSDKAVAAAPGTLRFTGKHKTERIGITVMDYDEGRLNEHKLDTLEECYPFRDTQPVSWVNINGLHDVEALAGLGEHFGLHSLVMEDILNVRQRPKLEEHDGYFFIVCRMVDFDEESQQIRTEQVSLILARNLVISFQERPGDVFEPVRERIRVGRGRIRRAGSDYLAYALLDAVADHYFVVLEKLSDAIETLEEDLLENPTTQLLETIHGLKREMILLRRSAWPLREVLNSFIRSESDLVAEETVVFLRDVLDHTVQVVEVIESFRDILSGLQDLYLSSISNRMNEVMKVLTIVSTIFVPLTFVAGIYGMNFEFMPELGWKWSYLIFWMIILSMGSGMLSFFRRRGWI
jgi:magnesium transporter